MMFQPAQDGYVIRLPEILIWPSRWMNSLLSENRHSCPTRTLILQPLFPVA